MDVVLTQLAIGVGLHNAIGWFAPIYFGVLNVLPLLLSLFLYADKSSEFNKHIDQLKSGKPEEESEHDFIIVGGGSGGSVVANRLSEHFNVLLLERGGEPNPLTKVAGLQSTLLSRPETDYTYLTVSQNSSCLAMRNNECLWNSGKGMGGSSMINGLVYIRGHPFDYNRWSRHVKDDRWTYENVLPYFLRSEGYCDDCDPSESKGLKLKPTLNLRYHNSKGELTIRPPPFAPLVSEFLDAQKWGGVPRGDLNAPYYKPIADPYSLTVNRGRRTSAYHAFVAPIRAKRSSLKVTEYARVIEVLFEHGTNKAIGVKYERFGRIEVAKAKKEIILSAGTFGTAKILLASGIGPKEDLKKLKIPVRCNLPVGKNLQDHTGILLGPFLIQEPLSIVSPRDLNETAAIKFLKKGLGPFSVPYLLAHAMWVSKSALSAGEGEWPDIQIQMSPTGISKSVVEDYSRLYNVRKDVTKEFLGPLKGKDAFSLLINYARPKSRGTIKLKSTNYLDEPLINPGTYEDIKGEDIRVMVEAIQRAVYLVDSAPSYKKIGARLSSIPLPTCKKHRFRSDQYWECFTRQLTFTVRHYVGSASMGAVGDSDAVVDPELKVNGVRNLRVIDASVMPYIVSTNTNAATLMIGERGADFLIQKYLKKF